MATQFIFNTQQLDTDAAGLRLIAPAQSSASRLSVARSRARFCLSRLHAAAGIASKRGLDIIASSIALLVLSPVFITIALLIKLSDGGPVFFTQARVGRGGREFRMFKFRSMVTDAERLRSKVAEDAGKREGPLFKLKNDPRITRIGRILRRTSLDELPQLLNVLLGDMSLVGPRPPLPIETKDYCAHAWKRMDVQPGITCTWQISGRSELSFEQQVELDIQYIETRSLVRDLFILIQTVPAVVSGRGAY